MFHLDKLLAQCLLALPNKILIRLELQILLKFLLAPRVTIARQFFLINVQTFLLTRLGCWFLPLPLALTFSNLQVYFMCLMQHYTVIVH